MSPTRRAWSGLGLVAIVLVVGAGIYVAVHEKGEEHERDAEARFEAGGEGEGEGGEIKDPVKRRYVERANEVCAEAEVKWGEAARESFKGSPTTLSDAQLSEYLGRVLPSLREMIEELRRLRGVPPGDERRIHGYFARMERVLDSLERLQRNPGSRKLRSLADTYGVGYLKNMAAQNYGLDICAQED